MDFRAYLTALAADGDLYTITAQVSPDLELARCCRREFSRRNGGRALLFEHLEGGRFSAAANLFGSGSRISRMLHGDTLDDFGYRLRTFLGQRSGSSTERLQIVQSKQSAQGSVLQPMDSGGGLLQLPAVRSWPGEQRPYLTLPLVITRDLHNDTTNIGLYRAQVIADDQLAINFGTGSGAAQHLVSAEQLRQPLPVALVFGADTSLYWAAAAPLPSGCEELALCQTLFNPGLGREDCQTQPLQVPAGSELIIEGEIRPGCRAEEGPFGNHSGQYVRRADCPLMQVTAIRRREQPIIPLTVVGPPPSENIQLAAANEVFIRELLRIDYPQVVAMHMPRATIFHGAVVLSVKHRATLTGKELIDRLWLDSPLRNSRFMLLVDEDIPAATVEKSWWRAINMLSPKRLYQSDGRMAFDATGVDPALLVMEDKAPGNFFNQPPCDDPVQK
ncbi:UbiD family decarboxylase [Pelobacter seleniigenes]|uniref:UbiD family decarboxylase n=1 Tax=Pelobacter seleniigenes TaxID=407188 RepID=UPI0004A77DA0|nr:UbiD family decarboxylase [Pelobacter seleniigenes]